MATNKILLAAGSAALLANFAFAQDPQPQQPQPDPSAPVQAPAPAPPAGGWRRFGPQEAGYQNQNGQPTYSDPQQGPPPNYQGPPPPNYQGPMQQQQAPNYSAYPPLATPPAHMTVPPGTWIKVHIDRILSTDHNHAGDPFSGTLAQPVIVNGFVIAHRGQNITGRVIEAHKAGRVKGTSEISLEITELAVADGQQLPLKTQLAEYHGMTTKGNDAVVIGTTTGVGAAIGGAVNGGVGAGVGAAAGLLASTVGVLSTRGRPTVIFPEALLTFKTAEPVTFSTERSAYAFQPAGPQDYAPAMQTRTMVRPGYGPYARPYGYGYPYPYYYPYPYFGTGIFIGGGRYYGRRW